MNGSRRRSDAQRILDENTRRIVEMKGGELLVLALRRSHADLCSYTAHPSLAAGEEELRYDGNETAKRQREREDHTSELPGQAGQLGPTCEHPKGESFEELMHGHRNRQDEQLRPVRLRKADAQAD